MATFLSLGIYSPYNNSKDKEKNREFNSVCNCLLYDIKDIVELFINSWQLSMDFLYEYNSFGIRTYEFDKYNAFNSKLNDIIKST
jgi:hypothetical protein